ncbi:acyl-CoA dehydrogenase [Streptomyces hygroscopicus subsp. jinggangensis 5008]|nr:acyl-CoA dehydrogenase [Streptomyces hygroscopicus subsp. jinggangensis 5008]AGF61672.1 acyl-CoA dehydrogenase [Streptomyces hygroscopicus subsp. jinggangensis TL01]
MGSLEAPCTSTTRPSSSGRALNRGPTSPSWFRTTPTPRYADPAAQKRFYRDTIRRLGADGRLGVGRPEVAIGYSEPGAGTDLAALKTRAVRDGDAYVVNGQKIWTTNGDTADWVWLAVRTDPGAPPHKGITMLPVPTCDPGHSCTLISAPSPPTTPPRAITRTSASPSPAASAARTRAGC